MNLTELLLRYAKRWPEEMVTAERFVQLLAAEPGAFLRTTPLGHITGSAWVVDPTEENVLLTHHKKLGIWVQLGGHADGEPNVLSVALKEAEEESGISKLVPVSHDIFDIDIHTIPANSSHPEHLHYDVRFAIAAETTEYIVSDESHDLAWVPIAHMKNVTQEESMLRMASKWLNR